MFHYYIVIAPSYILNQIELEAKGYGMKNSIANLMNKLSCTSYAINALDYSSQGRVLSIWFPNKTWSPPLSASNTIRIVENGLEMRKLWSPKVKGVKNSKKTIEGRFLNTQKVRFMLVFFVIKAPIWFVELQLALL
jgi:hypothetical protein